MKHLAKWTEVWTWYAHFLGGKFVKEKKPVVLETRVTDSHINCMFHARPLQCKCNAHCTVVGSWDPFINSTERQKSSKEKPVNCPWCQICVKSSLLSQIESQLSVSRSLFSILKRKCRLVKISAVVWRKVLLVLKVILRYGHLKGFFIWTRK